MHAVFDCYFSIDVLSTMGWGLKGRGKSPNRCRAVGATIWP